MTAEQISPGALTEVKAALTRYRAKIKDSALADNTQHTYLLHATNFVRWLEGEFEPGGTL